MTTNQIIAAAKSDFTARTAEAFAQGATNALGFTVDASRFEKLAGLMADKLERQARV
jgi:hypothetical protein